VSNQSSTPTGTLVATGDSCAARRTPTTWANSDPSALYDTSPVSREKPPTRPLLLANSGAELDDAGLSTVVGDLDRRSLFAPRDHRVAAMVDDAHVEVVQTVEER